MEIITDKSFELLKLIMLWCNDSICNDCEYKNDKDNYNVKNCKKMMKDILTNGKDGSNENIQNKSN